jgi:hypothetical protein
LAQKIDEVRLKSRVNPEVLSHKVGREFFARLHLLEKCVVVLLGRSEVSRLSGVLFESLRMQIQRMPIGFPAFLEGAQCMPSVGELPRLQLLKIRGFVRFHHGESRGA